jgi:hypothetical protein
MDKQHEWSIIQKLFTALQQPQKLYTGIHLKQLIKQQVLSLKPDFQNHPINSGRWSAYCHYSPLAAFTNLLDKHQIDEHSTVVIHSLLHPACMDELIRRQCSLIVTDITLDTLSIDHSQLDIALESNPDLIIHYSSNGLYQEITELLSFTNELKIPSLVFIDNELPTIELLELFEAHHFGSVIWNFGDSFLDDQLNTVLNNPLRNQKWYVSWYIETRTHTSLEYHLSSSKEITIPLLENYLYLLLNQHKAKGLKEKLYPLLYSFLSKQKIDNPELAKIQIVEAYNELKYAAIPDIIFEIEEILPFGARPSNLREIEELEHYIHLKNSEFFQKVIDQEGIRTTTIDPMRIYLQSTVYTGSKLAWKRHLIDKGYQLMEYSIHPEISALEHPHTTTIEQQGLYLDFGQLMYQAVQ